MAKPYYCFELESQADACLSAICNSGWFPITNYYNGVLDPTKPKTECFGDKWEMVSGKLGNQGQPLKWAVDRIPTDRLDAVGVPQEDRDAFLAVFGLDILNLDYDNDIVHEEI